MYRLHRFGGILLPEYNPVDSLSTASSRTGYYNLPGGGAYDIWQGGAAPLNRLESLTKKGVLHAESKTTIQYQLDLLKGKVGQRDRLYAKLPDGSERWLYARLKSVTVERASEPLHLPVELSFDSGETVWRGQEHRYTSTFGSHSTALALPNNGNADVLNPIIRLPISSSSVRLRASSGDNQKTDISLTGLSSGPIVIDCGAMTITDNGQDAYHKLTLNPSHTLDHWFKIVPHTYGGAHFFGTSLLVTDIVELEITYHDAWR